MTSLRAFVARLLSLLRARQLDDRLDEELRSHLQFALEENMARGMTRDDARAAAIRSIGGITRTRETWRETRGFPSLTAVYQDLRYACRSYRKSPSFTLVALLSLTLAIGANSAVFSLLNALVLRQLPVRDPGGLVQVTTVIPTPSEGAFTYPMFEELSRQQQVFSSVIGWWGHTILSAEIDGARADVFLWATTGNLYSELGLTPAAGRLFSTSDMDLARPSAEPVTVISYAFWHRRFNGDPSVVGRPIRLERVPFTIIGVAPRGFMGFSLVAEPDLTIPLTAVPLVTGHRPIASIKASPRQWVRIIGRLKPGLTIEQARAHLDSLHPALLNATVPAGFTHAQRDEFLSMRLSVASAATGIEPNLRSQYVQPLLIVLTIAGLVLLIACVNLASLMLSRAAARNLEIAVRLALGASPWRVARQMITEGLLLSLLGGACGVLFAFWGCRAIAGLILEEYLVPVGFDGTPDLRVVAVTTATALAVGVLFSLAPIWRVWRTWSAGALRQNSRTIASTGRVGRLLVGAQVALSLVLVANAGLLVRSLSEVRSIESGISRTDGVLVAYPSPRPGGYDNLDSDLYYQQVLQRISAVPGVQRASASLGKPATTGTGPLNFVAPVTEPSVLERGVQSTGAQVSPGFFDAIGIQLVKGRDFSWQDSSRARRVTLLSRSLAQRLFGHGDPIGQRVRVGVIPELQDVEVIGVAADARLYDVKNPNLLAIYVPALQDPDANYKCFVIRGTNVPYGALKQAVESLGHEELGAMVTMRYITDRALLQERLTAMIAGFFGMLALLLAGIGLYGLMSYAVAQRQREIGIRMALGADTARVVRDVIRDGLAVSVAGVGIGFAAALAATQLVKSLLFGVTPRDPSTLLVAPTLLVGITIIASVVPAMRAARVDPMVALRAE